MSSTAVLGQARILVVDDHPMFAHGLMLAIQSHAPESTIIRAQSAQMALAQLADSQPDLVLTDLHLPEVDGFALALALRERQFDLPVAIISADLDEKHMLRAKQVGAMGFIPKTWDDVRLVQALAGILRGEPCFSCLERASVPVAESPLTPREQQVLDLLAQGLANKAIEEALLMSRSTLKTHLESMFRKLGVGNRTSCVVEAQKRRWIS